MKRFLIVALILISAGGLFAAGKAEGQTLRILYTGETVTSVKLFERAGELTQAKVPGLTIEYQKVDLSTGAPVTMDTMLAAGTPPDIYFDSMVRLSRYVTPDFALPLSDYMDTSVFAHAEALTRKGKQYALPTNGGAQGMALNLDLLDAVGYTVPDNWTMADFMEMCAKVKAYADRTGKDVYGTGLFAGNQSGDYLWMNWFASFGVDLYAPDYTESLQYQGGDKVWAFFKELSDKGYIQKNSASLTDDDYALDWSVGMFAATAFFPDWAGPYFKTATEQGLIKSPHRYAFVAFPGGAGAATNYSGVVINKDSKVRDAAVEYINNLMDTFSVGMRTREMSSLAYRNDITDTPKDEKAVEIDEIVKANGLYDLGVSNPWFAEVRAQGFPVLQKVLTGKITPAEAAKEYTKRVNDIIR